VRPLGSATKILEFQGWPLFSILPSGGATEGLATGEWCVQFDTKGFLI
jgi:hypothetical protein